MSFQAFLTKNLNRFSNSHWSSITGYPWEWNATQETIKVNWKPFPIYLVLSVFHGTSLIGFIFYSEFFRRCSLANHDTTKLLTAFILSSGLLLAAPFHAWTSLMNSELLEKFLNEMLKLESRFQIKWSTKLNEETLRERSMLGTASVGLALVRPTAGMVVPFILTIGATLLPQSPINLLSYYPARFVMDGLHQLDFAIPPIVWIMERVLIFAWNHFAYRCCLTCYCLLMASVMIGCVGLARAVVIIERYFT